MINIKNIVVILIGYLRIKGINFFKSLFTIQTMKQKDNIMTDKQIVTITPPSKSAIK